MSEQKTISGSFIYETEKTDQLMIKSIIDRGNVPWYDPAGIADAVHQYQNGATGITYASPINEQQVSDFINGLLEQISQNMGEAAAPTN